MTTTRIPLDQIVYQIDGERIVETTYARVLRASVGEVCSPRGVEPEYFVAPRTVYAVGGREFLSRADAERTAENIEENGGDPTITEREAWEVGQWLPGGRQQLSREVWQTYPTEAEAEAALYARLERELNVGLSGRDVEWYPTREDAETVLAERAESA